jgi:hypothetical protein
MAIQKLKVSLDFGSSPIEVGTLLLQESNFPLWRGIEGEESLPFR